MSLNARIQEASAGRRSLDDVMFPLFAQRAREGSLSTATFLSAIEKELGAGVRAEFDSVIIRGAGTVIVPPEALGLCFERHTVTTFVPDFIYRRNVGSQRIVTGLRGESAASAAGLQEADEVLNDVDPSALAATTSEPVMLEVRRGEQQVTLRYVPRPIFVDSYEWTKVPGIPDEICRRASSFEGTDRSRLTEAGRRRGIIRPSPARSPTELIPTNNRDP
jgi:hypothetical protein